MTSKDLERLSELIETICTKCLRSCDEVQELEKQNFSKENVKTQLEKERVRISKIQQAMAENLAYQDVIQTIHRLFPELNPYLSGKSREE